MTKFLSFLSEILQKISDVTSTAGGMINYYFDLDTAVGVQLDTIGQVVGQIRTVRFQPSNGISPILDDDTYRLLLRAKIAQNSWDGKVESLYAIWQGLFPGGRIVISDSQNMSAVITLSGSFNSIITDLINNGYIVPRPQGVLYNFGFNNLPYFGFDRDDAFISGVDTGHWI